MSEEKSNLELVQECIPNFDSDNDEHWTTSGAPQMARVIELTGIKELTRAQLTEMFPSFARAKADQSIPVEDHTQPSEPVSVEEYDQAIADAQERRTELIEERQTLDGLVKEVSDEIDRLSDAKRTEFPPPTEASAYQAHVKSQQAERRKRVEGANALASTAGIKLKDAHRLMEVDGNANKNPKT